MLSVDFLIPQYLWYCLFPFNAPPPTSSSSLTNEQSRQNWETYGNPDGPGGEFPHLLKSLSSSLANPNKLISTLSADVSLAAICSTPRWFL